ncbi:MAG: S8 family serine peptidase, partial [Verrucomicrobia bacterium]|nr:S8 family serine peptidase [Verrucomicrobiota bacterium]
MRPQAKIWLVVSVALFAAACWFWHAGNERRAREHAPIAPTNAATAGRAIHYPFLSESITTRASTTRAEAAKTNRYPYQLRNTAQPIAELVRSETAILLQNALIETAARERVQVPGHLKSAGDDGNYIVQSVGRINEAFRRELRAVGAEIISYIPNNAYLVRVPVGSGVKLAALPGVQSVLPFEPYYKLDQRLVALAVKEQPLPDGARLNVTTFPGTRDAALNLFQKIGATVEQDSRSPFGPFFVIAAPADSLVSLAQSAVVQGLEVHHDKALMNDLSRTRLAIATNSDSFTSNYLNLTGTGIWVGLNDSGIDTNHADLVARVLTDVFDTDGHGTHVAGTIASSGLHSPPNPNGAATNIIPGSATNPPITVTFRGMAPLAQLFGVSFAFPDYYIQTNTANYNYNVLGHTNPMVANNSWGYTGVNTYDSAAASYDAAARDGLPEQPGMQQMLYVFAAGNEGFGNDDGTGFFSDTISSPATAKNVITVGALENRRLITNTVVATNTFLTNITITTNIVATNVVYVTNFFYGTNVTTNVPYLAITDSSNQVASFSSRGNVDPGLEGQFGRFKPDVVAPGVFTVSTRASAFFRPNLTPNNQLLNRLDLLLSNSAPADSSYRFESGTSMAAPAVSGMLALMQEFFATNSTVSNYSPALLKALVINGARSIGSYSPTYSFAMRDVLNDQGWGLPNLTNSLPGDLGVPTSRVQFMDQSVTNTLATGESHLYSVAFAAGASNAANPVNYPLRITLVWTDPPGNPNAAAKLVNDLDLVVSNTANGTVYYGNNFNAGSDYTQASGTNEPPVPDLINNVENVYISGPLSSNYVILVKGSRVNVNARTDHTNNTVQDYALVISSDYPGATNGPASGPFLLTGPVANPPVILPVSVLTNGVPRFGQRVGANTPLIGGMEGITNQWNFYVFTNVMTSNNPAGLTNGTNVAFLTFLPPNLSGSSHSGRAGVGLPRVASRNLEADIDLYVSTDPNLTNLFPAVLALAQKSTNRGGSELVVLSNAALGDVYYIGVKSEDQRAAEFFLVGLSTDQPFANRDSNGVTVTFLPVPQPIPDGSPDHPSTAFAFGINPYPLTIQRVVITNSMEHDLYGDLFADLLHTGTQGPTEPFAVLYDHNLFSNDQSGAFTFIFDDSGRGDMVGSQHTDGGTGDSLNNFVGEEAQGAWIYTVSDNATNHLGSISNLIMFIEERKTNTTNQVITLCGGDMFLDFVDVPPNATNLTISIINATAQFEIYVRHDNPNTPGADFPTQLIFDKKAIVNPPGGALTLTLADVPPLSAGRYYVMIFNPNPTCEQFTGPIYQIGLSGNPSSRFSLSPTNGPVTLKDDALSYSTNHVSIDREIFSVEVALRVDHPRVSDLAFHVFSPLGTRVMLFENRGLTDSNGLGAGYPITNVVPATSSGSRLPQINVINTGVNQGTIQITYDFFVVPDQMTIFYDGTNIFDTGYINGAGQFNVDFGPGLGTNVTIIMNQFTNPAAGTLWRYTASIVTGVGYALFTEDTNKHPVPIKFAVPPFAPSGLLTNLATNVSFLTNGVAGLQLISSNFSGGTLTDETGAGIALGFGGAYVIGNTTASGNNGTIAAFAFPITNASTPVWSSNWSGFGSDDFRGLALTPDDVYVAGSSFTQTTDSAGGKENKGVVVKYLPSGPPGPGPGGSTWTAQTPAAPGALPYGGGEGLNGNAAAIEGGVQFIYATGQGQANGGNGGRLYLSKLGTNGTVVWTADDSGIMVGNAYSSGRAVATVGTNVLVAGVNNDTGLSRPYLRNYDRNGNLIWAQISGSAQGYYSALTVMSNFIYAVGTRTDTATADFLIEKWDLLGNLLFSVNVDRGNDALTGIVALGNRLYACGVTDGGTAGGQDSVVLEFDPGTTNFISTNLFGGAFNDSAAGIATDGTDLYVGGTTFSYGSNPGVNSDLLLLRYTPSNLVNTVTNVSTNVSAGVGGIYLPEESLDTFRGESSLGNWLLEAWDTRVGAPVTNGLINWSLRFIYNSPSVASAVTLTNCVTYTNTVLPGETNYFIVNVPGNATGATNRLTALTGPGLFLFAHRAGLPVGTSPPDDYGPQFTGAAVGSAAITMFTNGAVPLLPGQRYYLGVYNPNGAANNFSLNACIGQDFSIGPSAYHPPQVSAFGKSTTTNLAGGLGIDYFRFDVASNAAAVLFGLTGLNGEAGLAIRRD